MSQMPHAVIAFIRSIMNIWTVGTSDAWNSMLEGLALAQGSTPPTPPILSNTSVSIESWKTTKVVAWVEAPEGGEQPGQELQLRMRGALEAQDNALKPQPDLAYGSGRR